MTFESIHAHDHPSRYPGLRLGFDALRASPGVCAVLNAANEVAVEAFLQGQIRFDQIHAVNTATLQARQPGFRHGAPGQGLVEHAAQGEHVGAGVDLELTRREAELLALITSV